ncbi:MAG: hypothetical protein ACK50I_01785 [Burkholderiales bacterium]
MDTAPPAAPLGAPSTMPPVRPSIASPIAVPVRGAEAAAAGGLDPLRGDGAGEGEGDARDQRWQGTRAERHDGLLDGPPT